jgi:drug/metabolite transporter (DMT)-like permease
MSSSSSSAVALGDAFCVLAACFYAAYDLRLYKWGKLVSPRELIIRKIATQACFSVALLLAVQSNEAASFLSNHFTMETGMGLGVLVLWSGLAVNMLAPFLQVGGQQAVGPTRAQTLYASQPLWAAMMAFVFQGETVGVQGMVGGGAFLSALFLAATAEQAPSSPAEPILPSSPNHTTSTNTFQPSVPKQ